MRSAAIANSRRRPRLRPRPKACGSTARRWRGCTSCCRTRAQPGVPLPAARRWWCRGAAPHRHRPEDPAVSIPLPPRRRDRRGEGQARVGDDYCSTSCRPSTSTARTSSRRATSGSLHGFSTASPQPTRPRPPRRCSRPRWPPRSPGRVARRWRRPTRSSWSGSHGPGQRRGRGGPDACLPPPPAPRRAAGVGDLAQGLRPDDPPQPRDGHGRSLRPARVGASRRRVGLLRPVPSGPRVPRPRRAHAGPDPSRAPREAETSNRG